MTRKKVSMEYIANDSERKASYKKRKKGLMKKIQELSTLCGVEACAVIFSQYDPEPIVYPSRPEADSMLERFSKLPEVERSRRMVDLESFMRERIKKVKDQLLRLQNENKRKEMEKFINDCMAGKTDLKDFDMSNVAYMNMFLQRTLGEVTSRMESMKKANEHQNAATDGSAMTNRKGVQGGVPFPYDLNDSMSSTYETESSGSGEN